MQCFFQVCEHIKGDESACHDLLTEDFYEAISFALLKLRRPITNDLNSSSFNSEVYVTLTSHKTPLDIEGIFNFQFDIYKKDTNELRITVIARTILCEENISTGSIGVYDDYYRSPHIISTIKYLNKKLREDTENCVGATVVLLAQAGCNPDHIFWGENDGNGNSKGLSLSY